MVPISERRFQLHAWRVVSCILSAWLFTMPSPLWWIAFSVWAVLCIYGLFLMLPVMFVVGLVIGASAGGAQADWLSTELMMGLLYVASTVFAIVIAEVVRFRKIRSARVHAIDDELEGSR